MSNTTSAAPIDQTPQQKLTSVLLDISANVMKYAPIAAAGAQVLETTTLAGADKQTALVQAILAGATAAEKSIDVNVSTIGSLVDFTVSLLNFAGIFNHSK